MDPLTTLLKELSLAQRPRHFLEKLRFCCQLQNFSDPDVNLPEKELKRVLLLEQLELMNAPARSSCLMVFGVLQGVVLMVNANLSRFLEASLFGAVEPQWTEARMNRDEPMMLSDEGFSHVELIFEIFMRLVTKADLDAKMLERVVDDEIVSLVVETLESRDPRVRKYAKTVLHRIYGRLMSSRSFVKKEFQRVAYSCTYEDKHCAGLCELLEVMVAIIEGLEEPLKEENKQLFLLSVLPMHTIPNLQAFHFPLCCCVIAIIRIEPSLTNQILSKLLSWAPRSNTGKQVMLIGEIEEIIEVAQETCAEWTSAGTRSCVRQLTLEMRFWLSSQHFQVTERVLHMWRNQSVLDLMDRHKGLVEELLLPTLKKSTLVHWNEAVVGLAEGVAKLYEPDAEPVAAAEAGAAAVAVAASGESSETNNDEAKTSSQ